MILRSFDVFDKLRVIVSIPSGVLGQMQERRIGKEDIVFCFANVYLETFTSD